MRSLRFLLPLVAAAGMIASPAFAEEVYNREPIEIPTIFGTKLIIGTNYPREVVSFTEHLAPGTIVVNTRQRRLYFVLGGGKAIRYAIAVGKEGYAWHGTSTVSQKREWPDWNPPADMRARRPDLPVHMAGGKDNPLGARALYLFQGNKDTLYRIHGTNEPWYMGTARSSGCIRMTNEDVIDLYDRTRIGATVIVR
jgi:lipoprotein-anchoring transpeptidase ErfK/SrfK